MMSKLLARVSSKNILHHLTLAVEASISNHATSKDIEGVEPISRAIYQCLLETDPQDKEHSLRVDNPRQRPILIVPITFGSIASLASVYLNNSQYQCQLHKVGKGKFILGEDNLTFGRWNSLVAYTSTGQVIDVFAGHGGELIPGKLEDHIWRLKQNIRNNELLPVQMDIDISMACPSNCTFCFSAPYRAVRNRQMVMDKALMFHLIKQWAKRGVKVVRFDGGGDPLTHPNLLEAIQLSTDLGMQTAVLTAGDLLQERLFETFVRCRTYVRISLNSGTDETRSLLHKPNNKKFKLTRLLAQMRKLADRRNATYENDATKRMLLGATSMVHPLNNYETFKIAQNVKEAGFDHLSLRVILGEKHRVYFTESMKDKLKEDFERIRTDLVDDKFMVFFPTRDLTDTGYKPDEFFDRCLACTHRVLIEVGHRSDVAANVPCGRYRGQGFNWSPDTANQLTVLGHYQVSTSVSEQWMNAQMLTMVGRFPQMCEDCIDRSANLLLNRISDILSAYSDARFLKFFKFS